VSAPVPHPGPSPRPHVLVADDQATVRRLLQARLEVLGYETTLARDGVEALATLERRRPDVALLDWMMPGLDGVAVTERVRAHPDLADLPIVLLTAREDPADLAAGLAAGADEFLIKPVHQTVLEARLAHVLRRASRMTQLRDAARHDPLTGLPNRRAWEERLDQELARGRRSGLGLCLALLDLDHFKAVNDGHGHDAGDRLLAGVADAWRTDLREADLLARLGGDEFGLLLVECDLEGAERALARLRACTPAPSTTSIGLAEWDGLEDAHALTNRADVALYASKRAGRDRMTSAGAPLAERG
jgi:diguanylate cyclase (GGDEF)-like protein